MDGLFWDVAKTCITGVAGFAGVWYGQRQMKRKDAKQIEKEEAKVKLNRALLATQVVQHLERYINGCVSVAYDDGTAFGQPAGGEGRYEATSTAPILDLQGDDVDWSLVPRELSYDILTIRVRQEHIEMFLGADGYDFPDDYFSTRSFLYAQLGQQVSEIALRLRRVGGIPNEVLSKAEWPRAEALASVIEKHQDLRADRAERHRQWMLQHPLSDLPTG